MSCKIYRGKIQKYFEVYLIFKTVPFFLKKVETSKELTQAIPRSKKLSIFKERLILSSQNI
jgi:hypothetical protein